ncbi:MAG: hypothetical protein NTU89_02405 [Candidatus Dependentiae bacterium]|nr:hypothetical protein [Candidatus Dependentiae bacterium]
MKKQILLSIAILAACSTDIFARGGVVSPVLNKKSGKGGGATMAAVTTHGQNGVAGLSFYTQPADLASIAAAAYDAAATMQAGASRLSAAYADAQAVLNA